VPVSGKQGNCKCKRNISWCIERQ